MDPQQQIITIEPELIEFNHQSKQLIKITNKTGDTIQNCAFYLYNPQKYQFMPDSFVLLGRESKLVTVRVKIRGGMNAGGLSKEFAYFKYRNINKRLTLIVNQVNEQGERDKAKYGGYQSGVQQINTLSARGRQSNQQLAYQKIIIQKQAYIQALQRRLEQTTNKFHEQLQLSAIKNNKNMYLDQIHDLQLKLAILTKQKQQQILANIDLHQKFKQYKIIMESQTQTQHLTSSTSQSQLQSLSKKLIQHQNQIAQLLQQNKILQGQCQQFLNKVQQKQQKIKQIQHQYTVKIDGIIKQGEKKLQQMQSRIQMERKQFQNRVELENGKQVNKLKEKIQAMEIVINKKQKQSKNMQNKLNQQIKINDELAIQSKKYIKCEIQKQNLAQLNKQLKQKITNLQHNLSEIRQQAITCRNKLSDQDTNSSKHQKYLQIALQSCKNENQLLKKSIGDLDGGLKQQQKLRKLHQNRATNNDQQLKTALLMLKQEQQNVKRLNQEKLVQQQQSHDKIMELKSENIDLLDKISTKKREDNENIQKLEQYQEKIKKYQNQLNQLKDQYDRLMSKYKDVEQVKDKMMRKIQKYKNQAKKSIKSISQNAKQQLVRIEEQKNKLTKKVQQLELEYSVHNTETNQFPVQIRHKTRTQYQQNQNKSNENHRKIYEKYPMSLEGDRRGTGIKNQRKYLEESQVNANSQQRSQIDMDRIYGELGQLRQFKNYVNNQIKGLRAILRMEESQGRQMHQLVNENPIFGAINFFKQLQHKLQGKFEDHEKLNQTQKQLQFLKGRLTELQPLAKTLKQKPQEQSLQITTKQQLDRSAIEYLRQQMKNQYKKLYDALKLSQQKYQIMRKKIYEEYRSRIIELISKKDRDEFVVNKIQSALERFVEGLGNTSHKQAVLAKQIKLKNQARKQAQLYKDKLAALAKQMENDRNKKGNCIRQPIRVFEIDNDNQWLDSIKMQAKVLTYQAQNARMLSDKALYTENITQVAQQLKLCENDLQIKQQQISNLKKQVIAITKEHELQQTKQEQQLNGLKKKFGTVQKLEKQVADLTIKQKENKHLREQVQEKKQLIKSMKENQKMLQQLLDESRRSETNYKQKQKKQYMEQSRIQQSLKDLKQNNRELRAQNGKLRQQIEGLIEDVNKKNAALKRLKSQTEEFRIKNVKSQTDSIQKLRTELREIKEQLRKCKEEADKNKRKKQREINEKLNEIQKLKSQFAIERSSLQSIIRALTDTIQGIYCSLDIIARKKGKIMSEQPNFDTLITNPGEIKSNKVRQLFDQVIEAMKQ